MLAFDTLYTVGSRIVDDVFAGAVVAEMTRFSRRVLLKKYLVVAELCAARPSGPKLWSELLVSRLHPRTSQVRDK